MTPGTDGIRELLSRERAYSFILTFNKRPSTTRKPAMLEWIALASLIGAVILLIFLAIIDLKTKLLPNEMVLGFATLAIIFHLTTLARFVTPIDVILGGVIGFGTLYLVRAIANHIYKADALGLGDVKLIGAGGLWLGPDAILLAMSAGALAGLLHGTVHALRVAAKTGTKPDFSRLQIPAGPGFAVGLIAAGIFKFWNFSPLP